MQKYRQQKWNKHYMREVMDTQAKIIIIMIIITVVQESR